MRQHLGATAAALAFCASAHASGNDLLEWCSAAERIIDSGGAKIVGDLQPFYQCVGTVKGAWDVAMLNGGLDKSSPSSACTPDDVTLGQLVRMTNKFMRENPDKLNLREGWLVILVLHNNFPCKP